MENKIKLLKENKKNDTGTQSAILIGNVHVGKTTIFNWLAGKEQKETLKKESAVSYQEARIRGYNYILYDIPGISGFSIQNEEEKLVIDMLLHNKIDTVISVFDAKNIRRSLALALQIAEFNIPMVIDLNMIDEAESRGIIINTGKLKNLLGLEINETVANEKAGVLKLPAILSSGRKPKEIIRFPEIIENGINDLTGILGETGVQARAIAILLLYRDYYMTRFIAGKFGKEILEKCDSIIKKLEQKFSKPLGLLISEIYFSRADKIAGTVQEKAADVKKPFQAAISSYASRLFPGIPIAVAVGIIMYLFVGKLGAIVLVNLLEGDLFGKIITPAVINVLKPLKNSLLTDLFCGEFGLISVGLSLSFGVVFPVLFTFYIFYGFLEDTGYLPRLSTLLDKFFKKIGLNGKGLLPVIMGFSCITMAILTTRMLDTKKEKIIATLILIFSVPCAPLLSVMFVLLSKMRWSAAVAVFGMIFLQIFLVGFISSKLIRGKRSDFIIEMPVLHLPNLFLVIKRSLLRLKSFMLEAVPVFLITTFFLFLFDKIGGLQLFRNLLEPFIKKTLDLPSQSVEILVMTIIRREAGAALLNKFFDGGFFDGVQTVVMLIVMTFLMPCINSIIIMIKERGLKITLGIIAFVVPYSLFIGAVVNWVCRSLGIHF